MKVTVAKELLVHNLKLINQLGKLGDMQHKNSVGLIAEEDKFALFIWIGSAFIYISLPAKVEQVGNCRVSSKIYDIVRLIKDEEISLKFDKALSITTKSKFKAVLNEYAVAELPLERLMNLANAPMEKTLVFSSEELGYLADVSKAFPTLSKENHLYVQIKGQDGVALGNIQPSEEGRLEQFPMDTDSIVEEGLLYRIQTSYLKVALSFSDQYTKLESLKEYANNYKISDPENNSWYMYCAMVKE